MRALGLFQWVVLVGIWTATDARIPSVRQENARSNLREGFVVIEEATGDMRFVDSRDLGTNGAAAIASFSPAIDHKSGFAQLNVATNAEYSDQQQMVAAGYIEGYLTAEVIADHWYNWKEYYLPNKTKNNPGPVYDWLMSQHQWYESKLEEYKDSDESFWVALSLLNAQFKGLQLGYEARRQELNSTDVFPIELKEWVMINGMGDMLDVVTVLNPTDMHLNPDPETMTPREYGYRTSVMGQCTSVVRVLDDLSDILFSQSTNTDVTSLNRIYKHYDFPLHHPAIKSKKLSYSGYGGLLYSYDDFYLTDAGLAIAETTIGIKNLTVYDGLTSSSALCWQRARVASWLAVDGPSWVKHFEKYNSGTYNNIWIILDAKRFTAGAELQPGLLTVAEQTPGRVLSTDATQELVRGYFAAYNAPYFVQNYYDLGWHDVYLKTNYCSMVSYQQAPRAKIFRRDMHTVVDLESFKVLLRTNKFQEDPFAEGVSTYQVAARGDLNDSMPTTYAQIDTKVANIAMVLSMTADAVGGPSHQDQPVYTFAKFPHVPHRGIPEEVSREWELQVPATAALRDKLAADTAPGTGSAEVVAA